MKILIIFTLLFFSISFAKANEDLTISISYRRTFDRVSPNPKKGDFVIVEEKIKLSGLNSLSSEALVSGASRKNQRNFKEAAILGQGTWKVLNSNQIARTRNFTSHTEQTAIRVQDKTCSLTVRITLKPGFKYRHGFRLVSGEPALYKNTRFSHQQCSIA